MIFRVPDFLRRLMFGRKVTPESVRDRLVEEHKSQPTSFFLELGKLITDMHDFQQSSRRIARGEFLDIYQWITSLLVIPVDIIFQRPSPISPGVVNRLTICVSLLSSNVVANMPVVCCPAAMRSSSPMIAAYAASCHVSIVVPVNILLPYFLVFPDFESLDIHH